MGMTQSVQRYAPPRVISRTRSPLRSTHKRSKRSGNAKTGLGVMVVGHFRAAPGCASIFAERLATIVSFRECSNAPLWHALFNASDGRGFGPAFHRDI
jgi:hypothetical protein